MTARLIASAGAGAGAATPTPDRGLEPAAGRAAARGRTLALCADDYGASPSISEGIEHLVMAGRLGVE